MHWSTAECSLPPDMKDTASPHAWAQSLFSAMQDKEMPCRIGGCDNTWTWFAAQQILGIGHRQPDLLGMQFEAAQIAVLDLSDEIRARGR